MSTRSRSWIPSPSLALMGTSATALVKSSILSYLSEDMPSWASWAMTLYIFSSKTALVWSCWTLSESTNGLPSSAIQPSMVSTLLRAMTKGVLYCLRMRMDSLVWGIRPSRMSMTRTARSARDPPLARRVTKDWCPGVSMKSRPGTSNFLFPMSEPHIL